MGDQTSALKSKARAKHFKEIQPWVQNRFSSTRVRLRENGEARRPQVGRNRTNNREIAMRKNEAVLVQVPEVLAKSGGVVLEQSGGGGPRECDVTK
eukprot:9447868-Lingulodinium_polyedra.AAC.1